LELIFRSAAPSSLSLGKDKPAPQTTTQRGELPVDRNRKMLETDDGAKGRI
jgi:hypothetical protein